MLMLILYNFIGCDIHFRLAFIEEIGTKSNLLIECHFSYLLNKNKGELRLHSFHRPITHRKYDFMLILKTKLPANKAK